MSLIDQVVLRPLGDDPPKARLLYGQDVRASLRLLEAESVQVVCTSPPYWGLRDYGGEPGVWGGDASGNCDHDWGGSFCLKCGAWLGQLGLEPTPQLFVAHIVEVFAEIRRVLHPTGVCWLNLGDSYNGSGGAGGDYGKGGLREGEPKYPGRNVAGLKPKDLVGIPWRVAFALQDDGWWLRSDIIWAKSNPMPSSVTDRPTKNHEYIFLLTKSQTYFYDQHAIRESHTMKPQRRPSGRPVDETPRPKGQPKQSWPISARDQVGVDGNSAGRNKRTVWNVNPKPYPGAHFAVWPEALVEPMVKAGSSEHGCCSACGAPYERIIELGQVVSTGGSSTGERATNMDQVSVLGQDPNKGAYNTGNMVQREHIMKGWQPTCDCKDPKVVKCLVLDPFSGSATTGAVAMRLGRDYVGTDLQPDYFDLAVARLEGRKAPSKSKDEEPDLIGDLFG